MAASKIALCMITKDSVGTIEKCLESFRPFVDGVFVYDTGSTDGTVELLERLQACWRVHCPGCDLWADEMEEGGYYWTSEANTGSEASKVCDHAGEKIRIPLAPIVVQRGEWRDDFSWAREQSFKMVPDEEGWAWNCWCDDDDVLIGGQWLRQFATTAPADLDGAIVFYDYARDESGNCVCQLWRERLLRRDAGYRWLNPVHEVLVPPDRPARLANVPPEQIRYVHHRPPSRYAPDRNLLILRREAEQLTAAGKPLYPRLLAYLGTELMSQSNWAEAAGYLEAYVRHPEAGWDDERAQVHHKLAGCLRALGNPLAAIEVEMRCLRERDDWAETAVGLAQSFAAVGRWDRAERWARRALELGIPQTPLIVNPLEFTLIPWMTIAEACALTGRSDDAQAAMQRALQLAPANEYVRARTGELAAMVAQNEILGAVLLLRETLVRHDENLKAWHLLQNVPYVIAERPEIVKALADQREMVAHYLRPDEYDRWYREEPKESTIGDELVPEVGEYIPRAKRLLEGLAEQEEQLGRKPRVLDLGCNDMWLGCYLWLQGSYIVDGVELNRQSVEKGHRRMKVFGAPGRLHHGNLTEAPALVAGSRYDAVCLFEVLEHIPDVTATLDLMESLLRPSGRIYISTPNGAYERGAIDGWARVERKGHLRAIPVHELAETLLDRGEMQLLELQHENRVAFVSYRPRRSKSTISFFAGAGWEQWSPASVNTTGLGGSETALAQVALRLAAAGHRVKVFSGAEPGLYGGALFRPHHAWDPMEECDLLVVSRMPHAFDLELGARVSALWCHDHSYPGLLTPERAQRMSSVVVLSEWERERFARLYPFCADKLTVIRNGVTLTGMDGDDRYPDADRPFAERAPRCVYSSSADRGLDVMLELWPRIRKRVPAAELHVFYGWDVFDRVALTNPHLHAYKARVMELLAMAGGEAGGVFMRGRMGQRDLAFEMQQARVWAYPTAFLETSCIGAMEARAAGLAIVTSDLGALHETVGEHGHLLRAREDAEPPTNTTVGYQRAFVSQVVAALNDETRWTELHRAARADVAGLDWSRRIPEWEALLPAAKTGRKPRRSRAKAA